MGFFPPNSNNDSGATILSAASAALMPVNAEVSNFGATSAAGAGTGSGGRNIATAMSAGNEMGNGQTGRGEVFNSDSNGGAGPGAGQANQTEGPSSGQTSQVAGQYPLSLITIPATPVVYQG